MIEEFNDMPWHDAELKEIIIDRKHKDNIQILVKWPKDYEAHTSIIEFYNCYAFQSEMNFGIAPPDFILNAQCIMQSKELEKLKTLWANVGVDLSKLYCFKIQTNSTNSTINIFSLGFRLIEVNICE